MPEQSGGAWKVQIYDTTLRDGAQTEGISFSCDDKIRIARKLDEFGVAFIEGGWPGSNPKDVEFFRRAVDIEWQSAQIVAFGSTRRRDVLPEDDDNLRALLQVGTDVCTVVGKSWTLHVREILRAERDENLSMIEESVAFLRDHGRRVIYDAEHFFDGYRADPVYAVETLCAAVRGGAEVLVLCDTNGGSMPWDVEQVVGKVAAALRQPLGIHCHNDAELAVANSLVAVRAGARHVQATINGYGERCGNANLCSIVPNLELKLDVSCDPAVHLRQLSELSNYVAEVANRAIAENVPYVGRSAFAHKGGIHVAAMRRDKRAYQHVDPTVVGNSMRVVVSELSGRGNLLSKAEELGLDLNAGGDVGDVLNKLKELEARGFAFEAADASVALMLRRQQAGYLPPFLVVDYSVVVQRRGKGTCAEATVKVDVGGRRYHTAAEGDGPVHALDAALRKALHTTFPQVAEFHLTDYKVRILDGERATAATTRVLIDTRSPSRSWTTVGASNNIIEASWQALTDSFEYGLLVEEQAGELAAASSAS